MAPQPVEKCAYVATDRDNGGYGTKNTAFKGYEEEKKAHFEKWKEIFSYFDIEICGDDKSDAAVRYANYQTVITASLGDSVHSLSAKGLTGEKYNQFVWWDCEIYQLPIFLLSRPEARKTRARIPLPIASRGERKCPRAGL